MEFEMTQVETCTQPVVQYAGFWRRVGACFIDSTLLSLVSWIFIAIAGFGGVGLSNAGASETTARGFVASGLLLALLCYVIGGWLYYALMESSAQGATLGKKVFGLRVTDLEGNRLSFIEASGRLWGKILSALILYIGFMMAGWTSKKQALHDIMAGTLVLRRGTVVPEQVAQNAFSE
jgi:uncharacterized RDD family membrane protein YckC